MHDDTLKMFSGNRDFAFSFSSKICLVHSKFLFKGASNQNKQFKARAVNKDAENADATQRR